MTTPYFIWDYDLDEKDVREMLKSGDDFNRRWLIARILQSAAFKDIWKYLTLKDVLKNFRHLLLRKETKKTWGNAFRAWGVKYS